MSHFDGALQGASYAVTQRGTTTSGISARLTSEGIAATAKMYQDDNGHDVIEFFVSSPEGADDLVASFEYKNNTLHRI